MNPFEFIPKRFPYTTGIIYAGIYEPIQNKTFLEMNPDFLFLERTRYGLLRIFQKLGCEIRMQNKYEWNV